MHRRIALLNSTRRQHQQLIPIFLSSCLVVCLPPVRAGKEGNGLHYMLEGEVKVQQLGTYTVSVSQSWTLFLTLVVSLFFVVFCVFHFDRLPKLRIY